VQRAGAVVVVAAPGAGKTTRVPPSLLALGRVALLQPRRVAARAIARRIAQEQELALGEDVGWQVRFERRFTASTRLLVMTEGVLTARLQSDPLLSDFDVVILDEFHERSLHADLALALARQARDARPDLRIVVMSATLDAATVASFLGGCPVIDVPGRLHPVEVEHAELSPVAAVRRVLAGTTGHVLVFLPGAGEIRRAATDLDGVDAEILPLHGSLEAEAQDRALAPSPRRKLILATNVAETSLTVEGVTHVVDAGFHKLLRFDASSGLDRLETERIPQSSADQRAGRAGRTGPGHALRLWDERLRLRPFLDPEIRRVDLASPFLDVLAWGGDPLAFAWFEAPDPAAARAAMDLLGQLGAVEDGRLSALGRTLARLPLHPRLARVLVACGGSQRGAAACALLSERPGPRPADPPTASSDVLALVDALATAPRATREAARELYETARRILGDAAPEEGDDALRHALLLGFPDRVARRRERRSPRLLLRSGVGATLSRESGVRDAEWLVALEIAGAARVEAQGQGGEPLVRVASAVDREWLVPSHVEVEHRLEKGVVRARRVASLGALELAASEIDADPAVAEGLLVEALRAQPLDEATRSFLRRARFAGVEVDVDAFQRDACAGRMALPGGVDLLALVAHDVRGRVDRDAPTSLEVPSGRRLPLEYRDDGEIVLSVKLQEMFGLAETPCLGPRRQPVLVELLSPAGRPLQVTRDLRSFWESTYPAIRREMRGRYPRHPWPEDPWNAPPTARARPRTR
jgi:ATP-dependent helicase HrpB